MGLPIVYLLGAYFVLVYGPIARLFMGWTTNANSNPKLFNVLSKCTSDGFNVNFKAQDIMEEIVKEINVYGQQMLS